MIYFRLLDEKNQGTIVRTDTGLEFEEWFDKEKRTWESRGGLVLYFAPYDENLLYDLYEEIDEAEAMRIVSWKST